MIIQGASRREAMDRVEELMSEVDLDVTLMDRLPHELSGGQAQRVVIARALAVNPHLVICDEPASALDATVKAQIADLLMRLRRERELAYLVIAHDLPLVNRITDSIAVMYRGKIVEQGPTRSVLGSPQHPYTKLLVSSDLSMSGNSTASWHEAGVSAEEESGGDAAINCPYLSQCNRADDRCHSRKVELLEVGDRQVACLILQDQRPI
jgi:oligopeptide/dipeptide ABC transporter ATP-binding protein